MYSYCTFMYLHRASWHSSATLTEVFLCFFLSCKANARVKPAKMGHGPHSSKNFVLFYILFVLCRSVCCVCVMCIVLLAPGGYPFVNKYNIISSSGARNCSYSVRYCSEKYLTLFVQFKRLNYNSKNPNIQKNNTTHCNVWV